MQKILRFHSLGGITPVFSCKGRYGHHLETFLANQKSETASHRELPTRTSEEPVLGHRTSIGTRTNINAALLHAKR